MKSALLACIACLLLGTLPEATAASNAAPSERKSICILTGKPSGALQYVVLGDVKFGKGSYGSVNEVFSQLADQTRKLGGDAIIEYDGAQRFGFWPWRFVRPVGHGVAIRWSTASKVDCAALGGNLY